MISNWLLIDIGNTRIKWVLTQAEDFQVGEAFAIEGLTSEVILKVFHRIGRIDGVVLSNVAGPQIERMFVDVLRSLELPEPRIMGARAEGGGVVSGYQNPQALGVDRWMALVGARARTLRPCLVVDIGSACTIDVLDAQGRHRGGYIIPGYKAMGEALIRRAHQIKDGDSERMTTLDLGADTAGAITGGTWLALVGAIERAFDDLLKEAPCDFFLTGGDAFALGGLLSRPFQWTPHLVLEGLYFEGVEAKEVTTRSQLLPAG
jgi:type III pantothenate kinase